MQQPLIILHYITFRKAFSAVFPCIRVGIGVHLDKILIGCIMLTIPGIPITYAMRDMLLGESITGLFRFVESLLIAASIAGGFLLATVLAEGVL